MSVCINRRSIVMNHLIVNLYKTVIKWNHGSVHRKQGRKREKARAKNMQINFEKTSIYMYFFHARANMC